MGKKKAAAQQRSQNGPSPQQVNILGRLPMERASFDRLNGYQSRTARSLVRREWAAWVTGVASLNGAAAALEITPEGQRVLDHWRAVRRGVAL